MGERSRRIRARAVAEAPAGKSGAAQTTHPPSWTAFVVGVALVLVVLSFQNGIGGKFVYDDEKQILGNPLIQDSKYLGRALSSDVWAFTGDTAKTWSNYWRPIFIAWLTLHFALFGADPTGWHVTNIALHLAATVLGYFVLRSLGARKETAAVATWLFAAHPAHVESITWISGSPDPMVTSFLFGAYLCHLAARRRGRISWVAGPALCGAAFLCKEIAIVFPAIVFLTELVLAEGKGDDLRSRARRGLRAAVPYLAVTALYLVVRVGLVGMKHILVPGGPGLAGVILSAPEVLVFYLRHALVPIGLGPSYPLRAVTPANLSFGNFVAPLVVVVAAGAGAFVLARRGALYRAGLVWFLLPLAPVFDVRSFLPEDFVHDRYLYLPLFGVMLFVAAGASDLWERLRGAADRAASPVWVTGLALSLLFVPLTRSYNRAWLDNIALWEAGVRTNPETAFPRAQLGEAYRKADRFAEARRELERALELNPALTNAHVALGAVDVREGRLAEAERHLRLVLEQYPDFAPAIEQLALTYQKQGKLDEAIALFERARRAIPLRHAYYTVNVAVLHRMANRGAQAKTELESIHGQLDTSTDPAVLRAFWYLGELYREEGQNALAVASYERYLAATARHAEPEVLALRKIVTDTLQRVREGP